MLIDFRNNTIVAEKSNLRALENYSWPTSEPTVEPSAYYEDHHQLLSNSAIAGIFLAGLVGLSCVVSYFVPKPNPDDYINMDITFLN